MQDKDFAVYTIRVQRDQLARMRMIAANEHRSLVQKFRRMIEIEIERDDAEGAA